MPNRVVSYYNDGTGDSRIGRAPSVFVCGNKTKLWRVSNGSSTIQTELLAIKQALEHTGIAQRDHNTHRLKELFTSSTV